jgi:hypothetical protein
MPQAILLALLYLGISCLTFARADDGTTASNAIPFTSMTMTNRELVRDVTDHYTLQSARPAEEFKARIVVFEYLMDHMEACSVLAQQTGLITYRATRGTDGRLYADDHAGGAGSMFNVYASTGKRIIYVDGTQHGLFDVHGRGVAVVDYHTEAGNTIAYTHTAFVKVDNVVLAALAQSFSIFLRGTVDRHFTHVLRNPVILSERAQLEPQKLLDQIQRMPPADQQLLAPFTALVNSDASAGPGDANRPL